MPRGRQKIIDEFTNRTDVSRQRIYQLRMRKAKRCIICGSPELVNDTFCEVHRNANRKKQLRYYYKKKQSKADEKDINIQ